MVAHQLDRLVKYTILRQGHWPGVSKMYVTMGVPRYPTHLTTK